MQTASTPRLAFRGLARRKTPACERGRLWSIQGKRSQLIGLAVPRLEVVQRVVDGIVGNVAIATPAGKDGSSGGWCELRQLLPRSSPSRDALSECAVGLRRLTRGFFVVRVHDDSP